MSARAAATPSFPATHTGYLAKLATADQAVDQVELEQANASHASASQFLNSTFFSALRMRQLPASGKAPAMAMLAQALVPGDTYQAYYDPKNGKLQYLDITHADGSKTDWTFDTENQYPWSSAVVDYNPAGQVTDATWNNKDGTYIYQVFDLAHGDVPEWITQAGFPDGHWIVWTHDTAGTQQWSQVENVRGAGGVAESEIVSWRNGTTETLTYDTAHGDALASDVAVNGGAMSEWIYDTAGNQTWSKYSASYANGQIANQDIYYNDGSYEAKTWDLAHGDALQNDTMDNSTGSHQTVWDTAGTNAWSSYTADWNTAGQLQDQNFANRDDSFTAYNWHPSVPGDPLFSETISTPSDGVSAAVTHDLVGASWNTETTMIDPEGRTLGVNWLWNNGTDSYIVLGANWYQASPEEYLNTKTGQWTTFNPGAALLGGYEGVFTDAHGDYETRIYNVGGNLTAVQDHFADDSSDIMVGSPGPNPDEPYNTLTTMFDAAGNVRAMVENTSENGASQIIVVTAAQISASLLNPGSTLTFMSHDVQLVLMSEKTGTAGLNESQIYWQSLGGGGQENSVQADGSGGALHYAGAAIGAVAGGAYEGVKEFTEGTSFVGRYGIADIPDVGPVAAGAIIGATTLGGAVIGAGAGWKAGGAIGDAVQQAVASSYPINPGYSEPGFDPSGGDDPGWLGGGGGIVSTRREIAIRFWGTRHEDHGGYQIR